MIKEMNRKNAAKIEEKVLELLKGLEKSGLEVSINGGKCDADSFTPKLVISIIGAEDTFVKEFKYKHQHYGIDKDLIGKELQLQGKIYTFRGFKPKARKNIVVLEKDGQVYVVSIDTLRDMLLTKKIKDGGIDYSSFNREE